jgi:hypothetical protein
MRAINNIKAALPIQKKSTPSANGAQRVLAALAPERLGTRWQFLGTTAVLFVLLILRRPDAFLNPQLWAEDGVIFFKEQLVYGFWQSVLTPHADYLHLVPRLTAALGSLLPVAWVPLVFTSVALLLAATCCSLFVLPSYRYILQSDLQRFWVCLLMAATPYSDEIFGNIANIQWYLGIAAVLIVFHRTPSGSPPRVIPAILIGVAGATVACTTPLSVMMAPFLIWRLLRSRSTERIWLGLMTTGVALQVSVILTNHNASSSGASWDQLLTSTIISFVFRTVFCQIGGLWLATWVSQNGLMSIALTTLMGVTIWFTWFWICGDSRDRRALLISLYLLLSSIGMAMAGRPAFRQDFSSLLPISPRGERYFFLPACVLILLVALTISRIRPSVHPALAALLLCIPFTGGLLKNYRVLPFADFDWAAKAPRIEVWKKAWNAGQEVQGFFVPIPPVRPVGLSLPTRRAAATKNSPWEGLLVGIRGKEERYFIDGAQRHLIQDQNCIFQRGLRLDRDVVWVSFGNLRTIPLGTPVGPCTPAQDPAQAAASAKFSTISVTPSVGDGATTTFTAVYRHAAGFDQFNLVQLLLPGNEGGGKNACWVYYKPDSNTLWLTNDGQNGALGPLKPRGKGSVENNQCVLEAAGSAVSGSLTDLTVSYAIRFNSGFEGERKIFLYAQDLAWRGTGWELRGVWPVPSDRPTGANAKPIFH